MLYIYHDGLIDGQDVRYWHRQYVEKRGRVEELEGAIRNSRIENAALKSVFDDAAERITTGISKRLEFKCSHCQKNTPLLIDALLKAKEK